MADLDKRRRDIFVKLWESPAAEPDADAVIYLSPTTLTIVALALKLADRFEPVFPRG